jgi:hypothetical protein
MAATIAKARQMFMFMSVSFVPKAGRISEDFEIYCLIDGEVLGLSLSSPEMI